MSDIFGEGTDESTVTSVDMGAKAAIAYIGEIEDVAAAQAFIEGEGRKTVIAAAHKQFPELAVEVDVEIKEATPSQINAAVEVEEDHEFSDNQKYIIVVDEVEGRPNFEVVGVNGKVWRIQRGVPAEVPGAVLEVLNNAVAERIVQEHNSQGRVTSRRQKYSAVPFRVMRVLND